jgi:hypothetical protein
MRWAAPYAALAALGRGAYFVLLHASGAADPLWATVVARARGALTAVLLLAVPVRTPSPRPPPPRRGYGVRWRWSSRASR